MAAGPVAEGAGEVGGGLGEVLAVAPGQGVAGHVCPFAPGGSRGGRLWQDDAADCARQSPCWNQDRCYPARDASRWRVRNPPSALRRLLLPGRMLTSTTEAVMVVSTAVPFIGGSAAA